MSISTCTCTWMNDHVNCKNVSVEVLSKHTIKLHLPARENSVLFIVKVPARVLCTGSEFQTFVWGNTAAILWRFEINSPLCVLLENCNIYEINEHTLYAYKRLPLLSAEAREKIAILAEIVRALTHSVLVFLIDEELLKGFRASSIISVGTDPVNDMVLHIISMLTSILGDATIAKQVFTLIERGALPIEILRHPEMLKQAIAKGLI